MLQQDIHQVFGGIYVAHSTPCGLSIAHFQVLINILWRTGKFSNGTELDCIEKEIKMHATHSILPLELPHNPHNPIYVEFFWTLWYWIFSPASPESLSIVLVYKSSAA